MFKKYSGIILRRIKSNLKKDFELRTYGNIDGKKLNNKKFLNIIIYNIIILILSISAGMLSVQFINGDITTDKKILFVKLLFIFSFTVTMLFGERLLKSNLKDLKSNKIINIIFIIFSFIVLRKFALYEHSTEFIYKLDSKYIFNRFDLRFIMLSSLMFIMLFVYILNRIKDDILYIFKRLDTWDKRAYIIATIISVIIIIVAYNLNVGWYNSYDYVYSLDCGWFFKDIIRESHFYEIRHPLMNIFTFPVWALVNGGVRGISKVITLTPLNFKTLEAIGIQIVNSQLLIFIALKLKLITKNRKIFLIYMLSFATVTYTLFLEKYNLAAFTLVSYIFLLCFKKDSKKMLISSMIVMPTSIVAGISELFNIHKGNIYNNIFKKFVKFIQIVIIATIFLVFFGRASIFFNASSDIKEMRNQFSVEELTLKEKINVSNNMLHSSLVALKGKVQFKDYIHHEGYFWENLESKSTIFGISILLLSIIGFIQNRKELFAKIFITWIIFSYILFIILKWSPDESPLFNIYFSWAIIPLFVLGLDTVIGWVSFENIRKIRNIKNIKNIKNKNIKNKNINIKDIFNNKKENNKKENGKTKIKTFRNIKEKIVYGILIITMIIINSKEIYLIYQFLETIKDKTKL